jgi:hypothetical protein
MNHKLTQEEAKVLWIIGSLERLATLGVLHPDLPYQVTQDAVDDYVELDDNRTTVFPNDAEIREVLSALMKVEHETAPTQKEIEDVAYVLLEYKNNRSEFVKHFLNLQHA